MSWDEILKGSNGADIINGGSGDDFLQGKAGGDTLDGGDGNDELHGDSGDDHLRGGRGNDDINGGTGTDTAYYSGSVFEYSHHRDGEILYLSHVGGTGFDGSDRLWHVERLVFADAVIDLTIDNPPIAFNDVAATDEDVGTYSSGSASVLDNDFDWEGDAMSVSPGTFTGTYGTLVLNADGTYTYTPSAAAQSLAQGQMVQDVFTYTVTDGNSSDTGTLTINLAGVNDAPTANPDSASGHENEILTIPVLANDTDVDNGAVITLVSASAPAGKGTASVAGNQVQFDPGTDFDHLAVGASEIVVLSYTITDEFGATSSSTVDVTVTGTNDGPVANADTASTDENSAVTVNVIANDTDVDDGAVLTVTAASAPPGKGMATVVGNQVQFDPGTAFDHLAVGASEVVVVSYTITDEHGATSSSTVNITVTGTNDGPVANPDTASTGENSTVTVNVLANDTDADDGAVLTVVSASAPSGQGSATVLPGNQVQFDPGTDFDYLDTGETAQVVVGYTIEDEHGAQSSSTVTITVHGANDAPVAVDDTASTDENNSVSGNVLANDTDVDGETLTVTNPGTYIGAYGTLVLAANGSYTYTPSGAAQALDEGEVVNDVFNYTASDGTAADAATLTITVTGLGGVPNANDDTATTTEDSSVSGNVLANDTDDEGDPLTVSDPGTYAGTYGTLTLAADGSYTYTPNAAANGLAVGEVGEDVFTYTATDGTGSDTATLTVTVTGLNDAPTIDAGGTDANGSVAELPDGDPDEGMAVHSDSGTIAFDDVDVSDTHSASFAPQGGGYLGTFTLDAVDQMGDSVGWDFTVSDAALEGLSEGEVRTQTYTVTIGDGKGGTATQNVVITITGAGVGVGPQTVWFIDNSTIGTSANLGTSADPYTSIAAFNAAQGTLGGPQVGHTVYLRAGTGTYAEADGINLLDGQTLTGVADGALRPTIVATAGDGINVAQNNTISGVDIGDTAGADIADSGGSVGTLTIFDVAAFGTGQIIDVDQGGTLNVTLNSAASTASSGGAVDLAGVGGTFTVSGATTITGVHSGGGIDVTGSSAAVSLAGGGLVSTGGTTAINYVGNSGSLALGGGLAIVTTSGAGLNASGGGTVTATGAGNSILSTTGTAVTISGTTIGAAGVTLESVSSAGAVNTIVLANTGSLGGLSVTGTGAVASGGTVTGSTGPVILATNTMDLSLAWMSITASAGDVLNATNLRGDSGIADSVISGFGTAGGNSANAIRIINSGVDLDSFTLAGTTVSGGATANDGLFMEAQGTSSMRLFVDNSTFSGLFGDGVQVNGTLGSTGQINVTIEDSDFVNAAANGNGGVSLNSFGGSTMRALVQGNTFDDVMRPNTNLGAINLTNGSTATAHFSIIDNVIEDLPGARGISFVADGTSTNYLLIDGNSIDRLGITSKLAINVGLNASATGDIIISDNQIGQNGNLWTAGAGNANAVSVLAQNAATMDLLIDGNAVTANTSFEAMRIRSINTAVMNATVSNNVLLDTAGAHLEFDATAGATTGSSVLNLNIFANDLPDAGVGVIRLNDLAGGVLNVTQTSAADVSALNDMATVTVLGTVIFGQPAPLLPVVPDFPM